MRAPLVPQVSIKTQPVKDQPERTYQAVFDTAKGDWTAVKLPWTSFVPVRKTVSDPEMPPLDPAKVTSVALVYSRFDFNKFPNPR